MEPCKCPASLVTLSELHDTKLKTRWLAHQTVRKVKSGSMKRESL